MNLTTRIDNHPSDAISKKFSIRGFPTLMFLDANGKEVAKPSNRSVEGFDSTLSDIKALDDLRSRISDGEKGLDAACLLREMNLGAVDFKDASQRRGSLKKPKKMKAKAWKEVLSDIDERMVNLEVSDLIQKAGRDREKNEALGQTFYAMAKDGKSVSGRSLFPFWRGAMDVARDKNDVAIFEMGYKVLAEELKNEPRAKNFLKGLAEDLAEIKKVSSADQVDAPASQQVVLAVTGMT